MAWAQEIKNLAAEIKTSHKDRTARIGEIKRETRDILGVANDYIKKVAAELKEMARELKDFLAKSEETRKKDFNALIGDIRARIKNIKGEVKDLLAKSEEKRMIDFKTIMKDIKEDIGAIKRSVTNTLKATQDLLGSYKGERQEAARYWASVRGKEVVEGVPSILRKGRRGRRKKE